MEAEEESQPSRDHPLRGDGTIAEPIDIVPEVRCGPRDVWVRLRMAADDARDDAMMRRYAEEQH